MLLCEQNKSTAILKWDYNKNEINSDFFDSKLFQRRLHFINKVKEFQTFALILASITNKNTIEMIQRVQKYLGNNNKIFYTVIIGKLNPNKLANFMEIDCFIWLGCPESPIIYDLNFYHDFHKPIITPIELILGLNEDPFKFSYALDLERFLSADFDDALCMNEDNSTERALTTSSSKSLVLVNRIKTREFQGLKYEVDDALSVNLEIEEGRSGIPKRISKRKEYSKSSNHF